MLPASTACPHFNCLPARTILKALMDSLNRSHVKSCMYQWNQMSIFKIKFYIFN